MGPYTKKEGADALDNGGWRITDGDGNVIAYLDTETMANGMLMCLLGEHVGPIPDYPEGEPLGPDQFDGMDEDDIVAHTGWNDDTMLILRTRYIDEDRHKEGTFENWIRKLAREEEAEVKTLEDE